jgi:sarcosine oxidase, subunit gamma
MPNRARFQVLQPAARWVLQGGPAARAAAAKGFGVPMPEQACRSCTANGRSALWLGPDEHLLLALSSDASPIAAGLAAALAGLPHSLVDVCQRQVGVSVCGPGAAELLNSGCPLDLRPAEFPTGTCARTLLAKAEIVLWRRSDEEFRLEAGRSFLGYVLGWLQEANA